MKIYNFEQRTKEWDEIKLGKYSASIADKVLTRTMKESKQIEGERMRIVAEMISKRTEDTFKSAAMIKGIQQEDESLFFIKIKTGIDFQKVGFCVSDEFDFVGCSPDALSVPSGIGLELKNPTDKVHVSYMIDNKALIDEYYCQCQFSMFVTGFKKWLLASYNDSMNSVIVEVERDEAYCSKLKEIFENEKVSISELYERAR